MSSQLRVYGALTCVALAVGASIGLGVPIIGGVIAAVGALIVVNALPTWSLVAAMFAAAELGTLFRVGGLSVDNYVVLAVVSVLLLRRAPAQGISKTSRYLISGFMVMALACVFAVSNGGLGAATGAARFLSYAVVVHYVGRMPEGSRRHLQRATLVICATAAASVLVVKFGVPIAPLYNDRESGLLRSGGLVGHPNFAAYTLAFVLLTVLVLRPNPFRRSASYVLFVGLLGTAILATGARLAAIAFVLALLYGLRHRVQRRTVVAVALLAIGALTVARTSMLERFESLANSGGLTGQNSAGWRLDKWAHDLAFSRTYLPWGAGWNRAQVIFADGLGAHNGYLQVLLELGALGVLGAVIIVIGLVGSARRGPTGAAQLLAFSLLITVGDPGIFYPAVVYLVLIYLTPRPLSVASPSPPEASASRPLPPRRLALPR